MYRFSFFLLTTENPFRMNVNEFATHSEIIVSRIFAGIFVLLFVHSANFHLTFECQVAWECKQISLMRLVEKMRSNNNTNIDTSRSTRAPLTFSSLIYGSALIHSYKFYCFPNWWGITTRRRSRRKKIYKISYYFKHI